jgi:LEA14-like dessication related protein
VGKVDANGRTVADVSAFETVRILPNQETRYQVSVTPAAVGIIQTLAQFIRAKERQPVRVAFTGTANVDGLNIPIQQTATL